MIDTDHESSSHETEIRTSRDRDRDQKVVSRPQHSWPPVSWNMTDFDSEEIYDWQWRLMIGGALAKQAYDSSGSGSDHCL